MFRLPLSNKAAGSVGEAGLAGVAGTASSVTSPQRKTVAARLREFTDNAVPPLLLKSSSLHPQHIPLLRNLPRELSALNHLLLFGASGVGKEYTARYIISKYSHSALSVEKKSMMAPDTKNEFWTRSSDIHFEIDFQHLGCRAVSAWHDFFEHAREITLMKPSRTSILLIKHFHLIPYEMLAVFHSYLARCDRGCCIRIIGLTEAVSHLPEDLRDIFEVLPFDVPEPKTYARVIVGAGNKEGALPAPPAMPSPTRSSPIKNIRRFKTALVKPAVYDKPYPPTFSYFNEAIIKLADQITAIIISPVHDIYAVREQLYQIPIQLLDIESVMWIVLLNLRRANHIKEPQLSTIWDWYYEYAYHHNHHYRYIYHIELLVVRLISLVHDGK